SRCVQTILVDDKTKPAIVCPDGITVSCSTEIPAADAASVSATDNCGGNPTVQHIGDITSLKACNNRYLITRTYAASDDCGNTISCVQYIRVDDKTPPSITCPADLTVACMTAVPAADLNAVKTSDNCGGMASTVYLGDATTDYVCANQLKVVRMYRAIDACGNSKYCLQNIRVSDVEPPQGTCPANVTVSCEKDIPCDGTNMGTSVQTIKSAFSDNCGGEVSVSFVSKGAKDICSYQGASGYVTKQTVVLAISDACGNKTSCSVVFSTPCICTYTQGFWGNPIGKADGLSSAKILDTLMKYGPIVIGDGVNCGFSIATRQCVLNVLPGSGPSVPLDKNFVLNCNTTLKNTAAAQLVALQLNVRYNAHFRKNDFGALVLAKSCALTPAQVTALGLGADTARVRDLIVLANKFLSSKCAGATFPNGFGGALTAAITALNEYWDECQVDVPCATPASAAGTATEDRSETEPSADLAYSGITLAPNPAISVLTIAFAAEMESRVQLSVFDAGGRLVKVQQNEVLAGKNVLTMDVAGMPPGVYFLVLANENMTATKRFVVCRD
ncbi:MAG: T9SS type A sorting domain-containing protein, partial [Saprospiraceae bacterium]